MAVVIPTNVITIRRHISCWVKRKSTHSARTASARSFPKHKTMSKYDKRNLGEEKHPYAFEQKIALRYMKNLCSGKERASLLLTYLGICWIASDFSRDDMEHRVRNWPKTLSTYTGLGKNTIQKNIRKLIGHGFIEYKQERNPNGQWNNRVIELPAELPQRVIDWAREDQTIDSETMGGETTTDEGITL